MVFAVEKLIWASYGQGFAQNLRRIRQRRRISQTALAEIAGLSRNHIRNLERRNPRRSSSVDPSLSTVYRLALALEVPPALLLPGSGDEVCPEFQVLSESGEARAESSSLLTRIADVAEFSPNYVEYRRMLNDEDGLVDPRLLRH